MPRKNRISHCKRSISWNEKIFKDNSFSSALQIVIKFDHDTDRSSLQPLHEAILLTDLLVSAHLLQSQLPQLVLPVLVRRSAITAPVVTTSLADERHEPGQGQVVLYDLMIPCAVSYPRLVLIS